MREASWGSWILVTTLVVFGTAACRDDDDDAPPGDVAGSSNRGGDAAVGAKSGDGGDGGNAGDAGAASCGKDCPLVEFCGPRDLSEICGTPADSCPTLDEIARPEICRDDYAWVGSTEYLVATTYDTTCGGRVVTVSYDFGLDWWGFDSDGALQFMRVDSDTTNRCRDGNGFSSSTVWGELPCARSGPVITLCGPSPELGAGGEGGAAGQGGSAP